MNADPYLYPNTFVLKNKLNIRDELTLEQAEFEYTSYRQLEKIPAGKFNYDHLKAIHKHLFQDLYEWAGRERTVRIAKDNSMFAYPEYIKTALDKLFKELQKDNYLTNLELAVFVEKLAVYFNEVNAAHPFREGNGRTMRIFFEKLAKKADYQLHWENVNREEYLKAVIAGFEGDNIAMARVFKKITSSETIILSI
jgi:cell filamentation protein